MLFYLPYFLEIKDFISIFTNIPSLIASITIPLVIIICYLIHLFIVALITRWFYSYSEKKSPSKSGIIPRNIPSKTLDFYHFRSFIMKYPKNAFSRGLFPWLLNWMYNQMNKCAYYGHVNGFSRKRLFEIVSRIGFKPYEVEFNKSKYPELCGIDNPSYKKFSTYMEATK